MSREVAGIIASLREVSPLTGIPERMCPDACTEMVERAVKEMAKAEGVTETLKETNQMEWLRRMNSIQNRAEETALHDLIYV